MTSRAAVILDEDVSIPAGISSLSRFRRWSQSAQFLDRGRIDFLGGELEVDLSPEDLYTHGAVKTAITAKLFSRIEEEGRGSVFVDRTRIVSTTAGLSVEPDVVVVLSASIQEGRIREIPSMKAGQDRFVELEGAPDLVVEVVSDSSEDKDLERLPPLYAAAGVPELWIVDARGDDLVFLVQVLRSDGYTSQPADIDGWITSPLLGCPCRLSRHRTQLSRWTYRLEIRTRS